jgi:hypothetical protein
VGASVVDTTNADWLNLLTVNWPRIQRWTAVFALGLCLAASPSLGKPKRAPKRSQRAAVSAPKTVSPKASAPKKASTRANRRKPVAPPKAIEPSDLAPLPQATASAQTPPSRGPTRIDFDDRLIQGQTNKSGAVYLYDRKELKTSSMVKKRESFRDEILGSVYDG